MDGATVLVVDDDRGDRKLLSRLIARTDGKARILEAQSIDAATEHAEALVDAVFVDHNLPGQTGLEGLAILRETWPRSAVFLMTGEGDEVLAKNAIQSGAHDYIPKSALDQAAVTRLLQAGIRAARHAWRLEEQRRDLTVFSEVLVHDFKAPIRAASFLSEQIEEDLEAGDMEGLRESAALLKKSTRQMMDTIKSLSDHVRLDRELDHEQVAPADIVDRALTAVDSDVTERGARVEIDLTEAPATIDCNAPQVAQVIQNLVANAIKYTPEAPEIRIRVARQNETEALVEIRDNGVGIPEEFRTRIFEPFKRVPGTASINGTGLGLATCKKIVMRHGGRIWCDAAEPQGTAFRFSLPIKGIA